MQHIPLSMKNTQDNDSLRSAGEADSYWLRVEAPGLSWVQVHLHYEGDFGQVLRLFEPQCPYLWQEDDGSTCCYCRAVGQVDHGDAYQAVPPTAHSERERLYLCWSHASHRPARRGEIGGDNGDSTGRGGGLEMGE